MTNDAVLAKSRTFFLLGMDHAQLRGYTVDTVQKLQADPNTNPDYLQGVLQYFLNQQERETA